MTVLAGVDIRAPIEGRAGEVLTPEALDLVARLHARFDPERRRLLGLRAERQSRLDAGELPGFLEGTREVRDGDWRVPPAPADLAQRKVEITGPVDRKMMINALNSGASAFMADFEDANSPTWANVIGGQVNLVDAVERTIEFESPDGRTYELGDEIATLLVRPRGWHLHERHVLIGGEQVSASLFDFALYAFHNAHRLLDAGSGPYVYLPKLESHAEARLWAEVFGATEDALGLQRGSVRATVLIETILAAFEMDEILHALGPHATALNAGRWDYIFSAIKKFRGRPEFLLPDRAQITMTVPFMRAYTELLVRTCHRRGAHAIGGMAAFVPSRKNQEVNEVALAKVREDKTRESGDGFDGTWVAHPDLVPIARAEFDEVLGEAPNQLTRLRDDVDVEPGDLLDIHVPAGQLTEAGVRGNVSVALRYLDSWLRGTGAAAIFNLMEDAATAEIARAQIWQWIRHGGDLDDGRRVTRELVAQIVGEELETYRSELGDELYGQTRAGEAREIFERISLTDDFEEFLTLVAYDYID